MYVIFSFTCDFVIKINGMDLGGTPEQGVGGLENFIGPYFVQNQYKCI